MSKKRDRNLDVNDLHQRGQLPTDPFANAERSVLSQELHTALPLITRLSEHFSSAIDRAVARREGREQAVPVAHPERAECLGGGYWPGMHVIVSGTGVGKSQLVMEDVLCASKAGVPCLYVALELDSFQVALRFLAEDANLGWSKLFVGEATEPEIDAIRNAASSITALPIYTEITGPTGWTVTRLEDSLRHLRELHPTGPLCVVLDYLQLVEPEPTAGHSELRERIGHIAYAGRALAVEYDAVIVFVSSTARAHYPLFAGDGVQKAGIRVDDLGRRIVRSPDVLVGTGKEAGEIEGAADTVTALVRSPLDHPDGDVVLAVTAKGRATGASWCALLLRGGTRFVPYPAEELRFHEAKGRTGRPRISDAELNERIDRAVAQAPDIDSGIRLFEVLKELGLGSNRAAVRRLWANHPSNPKRCDQAANPRNQR